MVNKSITHIKTVQPRLCNEYFMTGSCDLCDKAFQNIN